MKYAPSLIIIVILAFATFFVPSPILINKPQIDSGSHDFKTRNWFYEFIYKGYGLDKFTRMSSSRIISKQYGQIMIKLLYGAIQGFYYDGYNLAYNGSSYSLNYGIGVNEFSKYSSWEYEYHFDSWSHNISTYIFENELVFISEDPVWIVAKHYIFYHDHIQVTVYRYFKQAIRASSHQICMIFRNEYVSDVYIGAPLNLEAPASLTASLNSSVGYLLLNNSLLIYFKVLNAGTSKNYTLINADGITKWVISFKSLHVHYSEAEITFLGARVNRGVETPAGFIEYAKYEIYWRVLT